MKEVLEASKVRDRYASDIEKVIHYNDNNLDIYIYEDGHEGFLFSGELNGSLEEAQAFIDKFTEKLREYNHPYQFEWSEVDKDGNQIGEEFEIQYP